MDEFLFMNPTVYGEISWSTDSPRLWFNTLPKTFVQHILFVNTVTVMLGNHEWTGEDSPVSVKAF